MFIYVGEENIYFGYTFLEYKNMRSYRSVISGNSRDDEHKQESDYEFNHKCLQVRTSWECPCKLILLATKYKSESSSCKCGSNYLSYYISWYLQSI